MEPTFHKLTGFFTGKTESKEKTNQSSKNATNSVTSSEKTLQKSKVKIDKNDLTMKSKVVTMSPYGYREGGQWVKGEQKSTITRESVVKAINNTIKEMQSELDVQNYKRPSGDFTRFSEKVSSIKQFELDYGLNKEILRNFVKENHSNIYKKLVEPLINKSNSPNELFRDLKAIRDCMDSGLIINSEHRESLRNIANSLSNRKAGFELCRDINNLLDLQELQEQMPAFLDKLNDKIKNGNPLSEEDWKALVSDRMKLNDLMSPEDIEIWDQLIKQQTDVDPITYKFGNEEIKLPKALVFAQSPVIKEFAKSSKNAQLTISADLTGTKDADAHKQFTEALKGKVTADANYAQLADFYNVELLTRKAV